MQKIDKTVEKHSGISRRTFMKGAAVGAAGLAVASTVLGGTAMAASAATITVNKSACTVTVNGAAKNFEAYLINSNNYLKLRDIAATLNGTNKQFSVSYDAATKAVTMASGQAYASVGGEMTSLSSSAAAQLTPCSIKLDGKIIDATAYLINGNNFFKLRDIMEALDVYVGYDEATKNVTLDTSKPYAAEAQTPVVVVPSGTTSSSTSKKPISTLHSSKDGIYVDGENITNKEYDLPFIEPVKMVAIFDGEHKDGVVWRSSNKKMVAIDHTGLAIQRDGVGYNTVEISAEWDGVVYSTTIHTTAGCAARAIEVDYPISRGNFMVMLDNYFHWKHYNGYYDDARDIDSEGNVLSTPRVRTFYDVNGDLVYVKPIENAIDAGVLTPKSLKDKFYPDDDMTREEACYYICKAFYLEPLNNNYIGGFDDYSDISTEYRAAVNTLVGSGLFQGVTNFAFHPQAGITETEVRLIIEDIDDRQVAPVWTMPKTLQRLARSRTNYFCATDNVTIYYRYRFRNPLYNDMSICASQGVNNWGDWQEFIPGYSEEKQIGLTGKEPKHLDEEVSIVIDFEMYAVDMNGRKKNSPVTSTTLLFYAPAWKDPVTDVLHEYKPGFPKVVRFFDNFQACAYYIEGSEKGILFDGLSMGRGSHGSANMYKTISQDSINGEKISNKPWVFALGHNHGDHSGALKDCFDAGIQCYLLDRVGPFNSFVPAAGTVQKTPIALNEGDVISLGDVTLEVYQQPGHMDDSMLLYDRKNGLLFVSDIGGVNRYWPGDNFGASGVRQDLLMSLQQQLVTKWTEGGSEIKEYYTGHNRIGVSRDYMNVWEQALQRLCNYGNMVGLCHNHRSTGGMIAMNGDRYGSTSWQAFTETGRQVATVYTSATSSEDEGYITKFRRIETVPSYESTDRNGNTTVTNAFRANLCYDYRYNAHLSNLAFKDAQMIGHKFWYKWGAMDGQVPQFAGPVSAGWETDKAVNGDTDRPKFVLENKFWPEDTLENRKCYYVLIKPGQTSVTFTPVSMSDMITGMTVNGATAATRCPVTVPTSKDCTIQLVGPTPANDKNQTCTYLLKFVTSTNGIDPDGNLVGIA